MEENSDLFDALSHTSENVYLFQYNVKTSISRWSENAYQYFGLPDDFATDTLNKWLAFIHPDDQAVYLEDITAVLTGKKLHHQCQYRAKNAEGDYVWVECAGNVILNEAKEPVFFAGLITRLDNQSKYDPLTKVYTIHHFYQQDLLARPSYMLLLGMDGFRKVINSYGYGTGNRLLFDLASILNAEKYHVYRMSGDEFLVVLPDASEAEVLAFFQKVKNRFHQKSLQEVYTSAIDFSGAALYCEAGMINKETVIRRLEHSMEHAKHDCRGQLVHYSKDIEERHIYLHNLQEEMAQSIVNGFEGFMLYYQPVKDLKSEKLHGVEALLRYQSKQYGMVSPVEFIPILEETKKIREVGLWVMKETVKQKKAWLQQFPNLIMGFNVSYIQLTDDYFFEQLVKTVQDYEVRPDQIVVELTESCKVTHPEYLAEMFGRLMNYGFKVALDDFGMEYSSLTLIKDLPVTTVKIDHSFVRTMRWDESRKDRANLAIISSIIYLCRQLDIKVVIEGIETERIASIMSAVGGDFLQGYYYSKPVPATTIEMLY